MANYLKVQFLAACVLLGSMGSARADDRSILMLELSFVQNCLLTRGDAAQIEVLAAREGLQQVTDPKAKALFAANAGDKAWRLQHVSFPAVLSLSQSGKCMIFASGLDPVQAVVSFEQLVGALGKGRLRVTPTLDQQQETRFGKEINKVWLVEPKTPSSTQILFGMTTYSQSNAPFQVNWRLAIRGVPAN